jgi:hypothetical protein
MSETPIHSSFVAQVAPIGFADAAEAAEGLVGREIVTGRARLQVTGHAGAGIAGAVWYSGVLRTGGLVPPVRVDLVISPWSAGRTEIGIRPLNRLGHFQSFRARKFFEAAWSLIPQLVAELAPVAVEAPVPSDLQVAA